MRKILLKIHLYVALAAALFVVILGTTGSIMAFESELDRLFNPGLYSVNPAQSAPLSASAIIAALKKGYPGSKVVTLAFSGKPGESYAAGLSTGQEVFVDEYTGRILGERTGATFLDYVHQVHLRLLAGQTGKTIVSVAGICMLILVLSGIVLWWRYKQFSIKFDGSLVRAMFDIHTVTGIYSALFLLCLSATGIVIAYEGSVLSWLYRVTDTRPIARYAPSTVKPGAMSISPDRAIEISRQAIPGALPLLVIFPGGPRDPYNVRMHFPEDLTPGGRSWVILDQYSGDVLVAQNSRTAPGPTRADILNRAIHTGDVFGTISKTVGSLSSLLVVVQAVTGIVLWWKRDKRKVRSQASPRPVVSSVIRDR